MRAIVVLVTLATLFGTTFEDVKPSGVVRVSGRAVADDRGEFPALGASLFWAAWAYKNDRARLDAHLQLLAQHDFDYIRALGVVGRQPYWAGREIDARWPAYDEVIAGLTDHAFDNYGLRVEWTIFGDADQMVPAADERIRLVDRFVAMSKGREHKIMHFELANESWQNGFEGPHGQDELRALARRLDERTVIPVAISDSQGHECADHLALYEDVGVQILTEHFPRGSDGPAGRWGPVIAPWNVGECKGLPPVVSNNEPVGPRSSVESETEPVRVVAAAVVSWMAGVGLYVFHTDAGVWGREPVTSMPGATAALDGLAQARTYVPAGVVNWQRHRRDSPAHPFTAAGAIEVFASIQDDQFFVAAVGVTDGVLQLTARRDLDFEVINPMTGAKGARQVVAAGGKSTLSGSGMIVLSGRFTSPAKSLVAGRSRNWARNAAHP
ncbi:MAG: hypothetical protein H0W08_05355 [Acidobacteria bacterium]|nr:hypothetical protein [Acidobacteriota bacterium]